MPTKSEWDPDQYRRHADDRARPFHDLLARVPDTPPPARVTDLGCGAAHTTTALLLRRWPDAHITGVDNSPEMLRAAEPHAGPSPTGRGRLSLRLADITEWRPEPGEEPDLLISNAALHWVPGHAHLFPRWIDALPPGGVFAFQVPGNFSAPSHTLLNELRESPRWRDEVGGTAGGLAPDGPAVLDPAGYLEVLASLGCTVDAWETTYLHVLRGEDPVLDWVRGTTLRPVLTRLAPERHAEFLAEYGALLRQAYPATPHGTVLPFRRIFVVARKA
ncbi:trans-aconitate 2-methyltransferase [Allostreptomyces psammosilenae]|uniref:Trans-aconitate 2-methyltransferase n=1 Tax=Allostreptomyces psammosilenae TaxID=1892865 RepID=A0A852ZZM6_9ACTN|nr:trans-aconitate 2-methyltransferase [Allostreptomyces psammosilenae]NYI07823.1 trans-aconitate 2-methyltransferase [Allostreptomyces psammosilenae]